LNRGTYQSGEYKRIGKNGREVWIIASYNPVLDQRGTPFKIVKFATDITQQKLRTADLDGQITAIGRSQAVIEFRMDGTILTANDNFLRTMAIPSPTSRAAITACLSIRASATMPPIATSGPGSIAANISPPNTGASARTTARSGFRPRTIRSST
jgi:hypothetical protein